MEEIEIVKSRLELLEGDTNPRTGIDHAAEIAVLTDRIEALEKRITTLEESI